MFAEIQNVHHMTQLFSHWPAADIFTESQDGDIDTVHFYDLSGDSPTWKGSVNINHIEVSQ